MKLQKIIFLMSKFVIIITIYTLQKNLHIIEGLLFRKR